MSTRMPLSVVNVETAFTVLNGRQQREKDCLINLFGKVICVSEVVRVKDNHLFMVKFAPNVDLIIKRQECLPWQKKLVPYTEYILTNLRPTTVQKGSRTQHRVYTVTSDSKLHLPDSDNMVLMSESEIVKQYGIQHNELGIHIDREDYVFDKLFSYQGKVNAVLDAGLGVFELDNNVRLFVGTVPAVHKFSMLRLGSTVLVQNAHYTTSKQYPRVSVYCCMLTKIVCVDANLETEEQQTHALKLSQEVKKLLYLHGQTQNQLDHLFEFRKVLNKQLLNSQGARVTESIFTKVVTNEWFNKDDQKDEDKCPQRMLIDEFLNIPHRCPLTRSDRVTVYATKMFKTVKDLKEGIPTVANDDMEWKYSRQISQQVMLGILDIRNSTGQIVLYDDTESIDVVTCCYHGNRNEPCSHICTVSCDCNNIEIGDNFLCPYAHTCCIGKIVAVTIYELICETMVTSNVENLRFLNGTKRSRTEACMKYLIVDMKNVVYIGNSIKICVSNSKQKLSKDFKKLNKCRKDNVQLIDDSDKDIRCDTFRTKLTSVSINSEHAKCETDLKIVKTSAKMVHKSIESESAVEPVTSSLHKHVKIDGSIVFCRKVECCDKSTVILNRNITEPVVSSGNNTGNLTSEIDEFCDNNENNSRSSDDKALKYNNLPFKLGKSAFKVKPISNRKRTFVGIQSNIKTDTVPNKMPRTEESQFLVEDNVRHIKDGFKMEGNELNQVNLHSNPGDNSDDKCNPNCNSVNIYIENKGSLMCSDGQRRFNVECAIINRQEQEKVILEFTGKSVKWYPVLYLGTIYILSTFGEPVLSVRLSNDKLKKMLMKNNSRRCLSVSEQVYITRQWDISPQFDTLSPPGLVPLHDVLKPEFAEKVVSFEGQIVSRTLVKPGIGQKSMSKDLNGTCIYSKLHVQDASGCEDIWVYLNDRSIVCEKGLTPGNMVRFYGLERKLSQLNNIYTRLVPLSSVQILFSQSERSEGTHELETRIVDTRKQIPLLCLVDLWTSPNSGQVFQCVCDIEKILKVSLKCVCDICGSLVVHSQCSNIACSRGEVYRFLARASAIIDDNTSVAMVTLTGSSVQSMLKLSDDQWKCLEEEVSKTGEVFVQQYNPNLSSCLERFVYRLCDNHAVKQTWLLTMRSRSSLDINKIGHDEFCMKTFDTGSSRISTQCLPFLHLECLSMATFEPSTWAIQQLNVKM